MKKVLMIGAGSRKIEVKDAEIVTLDISHQHDVDIYADLNKLPYCWAQDNEYDEIHAYEVLEHLGSQGDYKFFFEQFNEFHRILKPGGLLIATVPAWNTIWAQGDPGHTRVISEATLVFLTRKNYEEQVGKTAMSDYRDIYKGDFETMKLAREGVTFAFTLRAL